MKIYTHLGGGGHIFSPGGHRGHIYIDYGPPDEINFFSNGTPYPHSKWTYYHIKGIGNHVVFRFVDRKGTGDFKLVPGKFGKKQ